MPQYVSPQAKNYAKQAEDLVKQNQTNLAIDYWRKAIAIAPKISSKVYKRLADSLATEGLLEEAVEIMYLAIQNHPDHYLGYSALGNFLLEQGEIENAIANYQQSLQLITNAPSWIYRKLGNQLLKSFRLAEAETVCQEFVAKYPDDYKSHLSLARVAIASDQWELALERLDVGITLFSDQLDFVLKKITALYKLDLSEHVKNTIQKAKYRFPNEVKLSLAEARLYQKQYDYQTAQTILDSIALQEPDNLEIQLEKAYNYWCLGQNESSKKILIQIKPQLELKKSLISKKFNDPYVDILLRENRIEELIQFFENTQSAKILNQEFMMVYCQLLISHERYQEALGFIEDILQEKSPKLYKTQTLLIFEQAKIKNIQAFKQLDIQKSLDIQVTKNISTLLDKITVYLGDNPILKETGNNLNSAFAKIKQISDNYPHSFLNTEISPLETYGVALKIIEHIKKKIPLSLIRLGDGEGNFLEYEEWQEFQEADRQAIQKVWWGNTKINHDEWQKIQDDYLLAIQNTDILGIPGPHKFCRACQYQAEVKYQNKSFRGIVAIIDNLLRAKDELTQNQKSELTLTSCHIHSQLEIWGLWPLILHQIHDCSVISCHEQISQFLLEKYGVRVSKLYKIPSEYKFSDLFDYQDQQEKPHYPDCFQKICSEITVNYPGEVFLVAAGFLGKIYCNIIKKKGGIALDIGSIVDYWLDYKTRFWTKFPSKVNYTDIFLKLYQQNYQSSPVKDYQLRESNHQEQQLTAQYYAKQAVLFAKQGDREKAILNYQKAIAQFIAQKETGIKPKIKLANIYNKLGNLLLKQKRCSEAEAIFQKLLTEYPGKPQGYIGLAQVSMSCFEWELAQQRWQKLLDLFPDHIRGLVGLGKSLIELKQYDKAEAFFQELTQKYPDKPQGYEGLADLAKANYQWQLAVKWWDISIEKTQAKSSYLKKSKFLISHAHPKAGFELIDHLIAEHKQDLDLLKTKADLLVLASRFYEAINLLSQLRRQTPDSLPIQILLSQALIGAKQFEEASQIIDNLPDYQANSITSDNDPHKIIKLLKTWQKYYQAGIDFNQPKIFGIGLSRTGTTSLTEALNLLGYVTIHFTNPVTRKIIDLEDIFYYDAFTDSPIAFRFEELYFLFPNAKFIYTERDLAEWVNSSSNLYKPRHFSTTQEMKRWLNQKCNKTFSKRSWNYDPTYIGAYGSLYANYPTWEDAYAAFDKRVTNFFEDKPSEKLLKINICAGEGWSKICNFLNVPIPEQSFPYYNKEKANSRPAIKSEIINKIKLPSKSLEFLASKQKLPIKIFKVDSMKNTPFEIEKIKESSLMQQGITYTSDYGECDVCVARRMKHLTSLIKKYGPTSKKYLLYTQEPRWDMHFKNQISFEGVDIHIMNAYTGEYWTNNYCKLNPKKFINSSNPIKNQTKFSRSKGKKIVTLQAYRNNFERWSLIRNGVEIDLSCLRTQIALQGHKQGKVEIYGRGWPEGIALEDSRTAKNWRDLKQDIIGNYHFNLCLENTNVDYYCTEKIWDSIQAGCLPIYYGEGNKIYEDFPQESFLDYANFQNTKELFEYIDNMKFEEFQRRFNLCWEVATSLAQEKISNDEVFQLRIENIMEKLLKINQLMPKIFSTQKENHDYLSRL